MFGGLFTGLGGGFFNQNYRAYPVAFIDKSVAEKGDKVILPPSALQTLGVLRHRMQQCSRSLWRECTQLQTVSPC